MLIFTRKIRAFTFIGVFLSVFIALTTLISSHAHAQLNRVFLFAPDGTRSQANGTTLTTDGTLINLPGNTVITPNGDVFNFQTGVYTPAGGNPINPNQPGGARRTGVFGFIAPDGTTVQRRQVSIGFSVNGGPSVTFFTITTPDGTTVNTDFIINGIIPQFSNNNPITVTTLGARILTLPNGDVIEESTVTTPGGFTINYSIGSVVRTSTGIFQPPVSDFEEALDATIAANPTLADQFIFLDPIQASALFNSFDDPLNPSTGTRRDDLPAILETFRPAVEAGLPIISALSPTAKEALAGANEFFELSPFVDSNPDVFCNILGGQPALCGGRVLQTGTVAVPQPRQGASLSLSNLVSATALTRNVLGLTFAQMYEGGEQAVNALNNLSQNHIIPAHQNMTAQLNTALIDQTRTQGSSTDAAVQIDTAMVLESSEAEARQDKLDPSELTCTVASNTPSLAMGAQLERTITRGFTREVSDVGLNVVGSASEFGPISDMRERWTLYTRHFCNPESNGGGNANAGCNRSPPTPPPTPPGQPPPPPPPPPQIYINLLGADATVPFRQITDGDINVENFLLRDTIDFDNEEEILASYAMMRNLIIPGSPSVIPPAAIEDNPIAQAAFVKRRQQQALRDIPASVVSGIIGRRASIPNSTNALEVQAIRLKAGVAADNISNKPSYNETMLALTKERFFDPDYFLRVGSLSEGEIKQEQLGVDMLIGIIQQDIYTLQEQMNALMAARTSVKLNRDDLGNTTSERPSSN